MENPSNTTLLTSTPFNRQIAGKIPATLLASQLVLFLAVHASLGVFSRLNHSIGLVHQLITFAVGIYCVLTARQKPERLVYICAYIVGAEVFWRMNGESIFHEFAKYAISFLFFLGILQRQSQKVPTLAFAYFVLLLPAAYFTIDFFEVGQAREVISFNLAGPMTLMVCVWYLHSLKFSPNQIHRTLLAALIPITSSSAYSLYKLTTTPNASLVLSGSSSLTSGGFSPNQVSAILGLGVLIAFLCLMLDEGSSRFSKTVLFGMMIVLGIQSALTFSRGGLYLATGSIAIAVIFFVRNSRTRINLLIIGVLLFGIVNYVVLPQLDKLTGGSIILRFSDTTMSNREILTQDDIEIWKDNLLFGVGPGVSAYIRPSGIIAVGHTEYTRALAEHGILGLLSLVCLFLMVMSFFLKTTNHTEKALVAASLVWSVLFWAANDTRLAAPSFMVGMAALIASTGKVVDEDRNLYQPISK